MKETLQNPEAFNTWQKDKTYFTVLKQYKSVIPSIEILISMVIHLSFPSFLPILTFSLSTAAADEPTLVHANPPRSFQVAHAGDLRQND